jgi:two-component system chemotaxis response regulator CheB
MSEIKVVKRRNDTPIHPKTAQIVQPAVYIKPDMDYKVLAIGASAGGPEGLTTILSGLPIDFPLPVFIVQHIDSHFLEGFATWLNGYSKLPVVVPVNGQKMVSGTVYLPPGDHHLMVAKNRTITVTKDLPFKGLRPSVSVLFKSVANVFGGNSVAVLLSGMGKDGAAELKQLFDLGAFTIVQDEASSLVFGMPGEAVKLGAACKILAPPDIVSEINRLINF